MTSDTPFEVVNLRNSDTQQHYGVLMSNSQIDTSNPFNSDLETRLFEYLGDDSSCMHCGHNNTTSAVIMGDFYEFDQETKLWKRRKPLIFYQPMLTSDFIISKHQELSKDSVSEVYSLPELFWENPQREYSRRILSSQDFDTKSKEDAYRRILYEIITFNTNQIN